LYIKEDQRAKPDARKHNAQTADSLHKVRNVMQYCIAQMLLHTVLHKDVAYIPRLAALR
jgi:hypothetical protein